MFRSETDMLQMRKDNNHREYHLVEEHGSENMSKKKEYAAKEEFEIHKKYDDNVLFLIIVIDIAMIIAIIVLFWINNLAEIMNPCEAGLMNYMQEWDGSWDTKYNVTCRGVLVLDYETGNIEQLTYNMIEDTKQTVYNCYAGTEKVEKIAVEHMVKVCPSDLKILVKK